MKDRPREELGEDRKGESSGWWAKGKGGERGVEGEVRVVCCRLGGEVGELLDEGEILEWDEEVWLPRDLGKVDGRRGGLPVGEDWAETVGRGDKGEY